MLDKMYKCPLVGEKQRWEKGKNGMHRRFRRSGDVGIGLQRHAALRATRKDKVLVGRGGSMDVFGADRSCTVHSRFTDELIRARSIKQLVQVSNSSNRPWCPATSPARRSQPRRPASQSRASREEIDQAPAAGGEGSRLAQHLVVWHLPESYTLS